MRKISQLKGDMKKAQEAQEVTTLTDSTVPYATGCIYSLTYLNSARKIHNQPLSTLICRSGFTYPLLRVSESDATQAEYNKENHRASKLETKIKECTVCLQEIGLTIN